MFNLLDKFRFTANSGGGDVTVIPMNTGLRRRWELQDDGVAYRRTLSTELVFRRSDDPDSYTFFFDAYDNDICDVSILIEQFCGGEWVEFFTGKIAPSEGKWDFDKCEAAFRVTPDDVYECAKNNFPKENNWLTYGTAKTIKAIYGEIQTTICSYDGLVVIPNVQLLFLRDCFSGGTHDVQFDPDPDPALAWTPVAHSQVFTGSVVGVSEVSIDTTWKREYVNQPTQPPGYGWINIGGDDWVRPVAVVSSTQTQTELSYSYTAEFLDETFEVSNGRLLSVLLEYAADATGCDISEVRSDFYGINADDTNPTNDAYDYAKDDEGVMQSVLVFQKSDVVNADASNDATYFTMNLADFLTALRDSQNVHWAILQDGSDFILRVEHLTYFDGAAGMDLTTLADGKYIRGLNRFETEGDIPAFERLAYQESFNAEFQPKLISYGCATGGQKDYQLSQMCADFGGLLNNDAAGLQGFVFVCAYLISGNDYLLDTLGGIANGAMAWKNLINNLWVFGRYSNTATSTAGGAFAVQTLKKRKAQASIQMQFCCEAFEPTETVETALGDGKVKSAEQNTETGMLTLNLLHE